MKKTRFLAVVLLVSFWFSVFGVVYFAGVRVNLTSSLPQRLWIVRPIGASDDIRRGEYVVVPPSKIDTTRFDSRTRTRYFGGKASFLKEVFGLPGETMVDIDGLVSLLSSDSEGYPLPRFPLPYRLGSDEYWLSSNKERGFDSRYFGPVKRQSIEAKAVPIF
jgi:conjugative transfer signal peptidase TraF